MKREIRRLRLKPGDIVVVRSRETTQRLQRIPGHHPFPVPIVELREHESIHRLSLEYLERIVERAKAAKGAS